MCTVFAESEVVSLVAQNKDVADIIHGLNVSVASKVGALAARPDRNNPGEYMMTGGVAQNQGIVEALEEKLGAKLYICDEAQLAEHSVRHCLRTRSARLRSKERVKIRHSVMKTNFMAEWRILSQPDKLFVG